MMFIMFLTGHMNQQLTPRRSLPEEHRPPTTVVHPVLYPVATPSSCRCTHFWFQISSPSVRWSLSSYVASWCWPLWLETSDIPNELVFTCTGCTKGSCPLRIWLNFWRTIERYDIKFCALVNHLLICKSGKFHCIIYRIDNIMLLLVTAT